VKSEDIPQTLPNTSTDSTGSSQKAKTAKQGRVDVTRRYTFRINMLHLFPVPYHPILSHLITKMVIQPRENSTAEKTVLETASLGGNSTRTFVQRVRYYRLKNHGTAEKQHLSAAKPMRGFIETVGNHLRGSQDVLDFFLIFFPSLYILPFSPSTGRSHGSDATGILI
jgi:hypothetical protein